MPNRFYPAALYNRSNSYVSVEDGATQGATLNVNLYDSNGNVIPTSFFDAAAAVAAHVALADPHPQYLTTAEANALYPSIGAADPYPQYLTAAEGDALFTTPAEVAASYVNKGGDTMTGQLTVNSIIKATGELQTTWSNGLRIVQGNYGAILRQDGADFYFLTTASGDQYGSWNSLRPLSFNVTTGNVSMGHNATVGGHLATSTLSAGPNTSVAFGAKATIHSASGTQAYLNLWQSGISTGGIGFLASSQTMRVVNTTATGSLVDGLGIDIDTLGRVGINGAPGTLAYHQLKVNGGVQSVGSFSQFEFTDRSTGAAYSLYATGGSMRIFNGGSDVFNMTLAGGVTLSNTLVVNQTITSAGTNAGYFFSNRAGTARTYGWYATGNVVRLDVSGIGSGFAISESGNTTASNVVTGGWGGSTAYGGIYHTQMTASDYIIMSGGSPDPNTYISTLATAGGNVVIRPNGNVGTYATTFSNTLITTETAYARRNAAGGGVNTLPRIFIQSGDPGTAAADGDLWFW